MFRLWLPDGVEVVLTNFDDFAEWTPCELEAEQMEMYLDLCDENGENWSAWLPLEVDS